MRICANCKQEVETQLPCYCGSCGAWVELEERADRQKPRIRRRKPKRNLFVGLALLALVYFVISISMLRQAPERAPKHASGNIITAKLPGKEELDQVFQPPDYILSDSDTRKLTEADVYMLTKQQLRIARSEILARHGYMFADAELQSYFARKHWYHANPSYKGELGGVESYNVQLLQRKEQQ
ncbi:YARHG domain-containing protein [Ectobacillus ponti]|uniref:YARHG domain-containing protein n=1 Tax=Ectobacillus ponti TaxID=2961894 RepID=A0AA41X921_9BACI|nr:YARHG domain-containing protein [Ectobacillus ponti]MCP8971042.1 YARHG domain-containing protein [Ectobacillus ponti]